MWPTASNGLRLLRYSAFLTPSPSLLAAARPAPALNHHKMEKKPSFAVSSSSSSSSSSLSKRSGRGRGMNPGGGRAREEDDRRSRKDGKMDKIDALGRLLTRILRHMASQLNLEMRSDGYVRVRDLLQLNLTTFANVKLKSHTIDDIREAVRRDNKQRFSLSEENGELLIRANQGHTVELIESEKLLKPILSVDEVPVCVHGTYRKNLESILQSGLKRMKRLHVHFSSGLPTDGEVISGHRKILGMPHQWLNPPLALHRIRSLDALFCGLGMRRDVNVLIFLDVRKALEEGMKLYISDNKVILTEGFDGVVPVKYFEKIETWPGRQPVPLLSSGCKG